MLDGSSEQISSDWREILARDYCDPAHHVSFLRAIGRRLRRNYVWILLIQGISYFGKVMIHPSPLNSVDQLWDRVAIGPIPGQVIILCGIAFNLGWLAVAAGTYYLDHLRYREQKTRIAMG